MTRNLMNDYQLPALSQVASKPFFVVETLYQQDDMKTQETKPPYEVRAMDMADAFKQVVSKHEKHEGYVSSAVVANSVVDSTYREGWKRAAIVNPGSLDDCI